MDYLEQSSDFERQLVFLENRYGLGRGKADGPSASATSPTSVDDAASRGGNLREMNLSIPAPDMSKTVSMPNLENKSAAEKDVDKHQVGQGLRLERI